MGCTYKLAEVSQNSQSNLAKKSEIDRTNITRNKTITSMIEHPTLVKRPTLESDKFIEVSFSPNHYAKIFAQM